MLTEMLKKHFFYLSIYDMAAFDRNCYVLKKILTLHSVKVSSSPNLPL